MSGTATRVPLIHADLPPSQRRAFGRWVRSVYGLVEHFDHCPFGCTAERTACSDGGAAIDDEQAQWQAWRAARGETEP